MALSDPFAFLRTAAPGSTCCGFVCPLGSRRPCTVSSRHRHLHAAKATARANGQLGVLDHTHTLRPTTKSPSHKPPADSHRSHRAGDQFSNLPTPLEPASGLVREPFLCRELHLVPSAIRGACELSRPFSLFLDGLQYSRRKARTSGQVIPPERPQACLFDVELFLTRKLVSLRKIARGAGYADDERAQGQWRQRWREHRASAANASGGSRSLAGGSMLGADVACERRNHERGANTDPQGLGLTPPTAHRTVLRRPRRSR
jgi:hypothetical protein